MRLALVVAVATLVRSAPITKDEGIEQLDKLLSAGILSKDAHAVRFVRVRSFGPAFTE